ncbi:hypothetical protein ACWFNE_06900 [Cellulomonas sp. NPDC055163]
MTDAFIETLPDWVQSLKLILGQAYARHVARAGHVIEDVVTPTGTELLDRALTDNPLLEATSFDAVEAGGLQCPRTSTSTSTVAPTAARS